MAAASEAQKQLQLYQYFQTQHQRLLRLWSRCLQGPLRDVYKAALGLGTANQLTNILRDVGEDSTERNRIYVPTEELAQFGISESEVSRFSSHILLCQTKTAQQCVFARSLFSKQ